MRLVPAVVLITLMAAAAVVAARSCGTEGADSGGTASVGVPGEAGGGARVGTVAGGPVADGGRPARRRPRRRAGDDPAASDEAVATEPTDDAWDGRKALIEGVVKWPDGSPVADALVTLGDIEDSYAATTSAADGTFGIDELPSYSSVAAVVVRDGQVWGGRVAADGGPLDLELTLSPPKAGDVWRLVHVVGWDGGAVDGGHATVLRRGRDIRWDTNDVAIAGGRFVADTRATDDGATALYVVTDPRDAEGRPLPYGPVLVDADRLEDPVTTFRLPPGVSLAGRVVGPDGAPVPGAVVVLAPPSPDEFDADHMPRWDEKVRTDAQGRFTFDGLRRGTGRLTVSAGRTLARAPERDVVCGGEDVVVRLDGVVSATIDVLDSEGKPVAGADVWCADPPESATAKTGADGTARLEGLRAGVATTLGADCAGRVRTTVVGWVAADTRIVLPTDHPIEGKVVDAAGQPVPEAPLTVVRRRGNSLVRPVDLHRDGSFVIADMEEGSEAELCLVDRGRTVARTVAVAGAKDVRLVWDDPSRFAVAFERHDGDAWKGAALVTLRGEGGDLATITGLPSSLLTFDAAALPPSVDVQVGPLANGRWAVLRNVVPRGVLRVPESAWRSGRTLSGQVTRSDGGDPAAAATVVVSDGEGFVVRVRTAADGTFRVPGVPTSRLTLRAEGAAGDAADPHTADAGTDDLVVSLRVRD